MDESWGLAAPVPATNADKFKSDLKLLMVDMVKKFGGPEQYLRARYGTKAAKQEWLNLQRSNRAVGFLQMKLLPQWLTCPFQI